MEEQKISILGLGRMGNPIGRFISDSKNYKVIVWNRDNTKAELFVKQNHGSESRESSKEALLSTQISILLLWDSKSIESILSSLADTDYKGRTFINMCTISPTESIAFSERITKLQGKWIEAPLLGSSKVAEAGKLQILIGGEKEDFDTFQDLFSLFGTPKHVGIVGTASATKLALNSILATHLTSFATSYSYLEACGANVDVFANILQTGPFNIAGGYYTTWENRIKSQDFDSNIAFTVSGISKDASLAVTEMTKFGIDASIFEGASKIISRAVEEGDTDKDMSAVVKHTKAKK